MHDQLKTPGNLKICHSLQSTSGSLSLGMVKLLQYDLILFSTKLQND